MKKLALAALVAVFLFGTVNTASAEFSSAGGFMNMYFQWADNLNFAKKDGEDDFNAAQRTRMFFDYTASENLMANVKFEIDTTWGGTGATAGDIGQGGGGDIGADGINIETKNAFIKWTVPNTDLIMTMGIQGLGLPSATYGNPVLTDDMAGIVASNTFNDMVSATLFWARLDNDQGAETAANNANTQDEFDIVGLILPISFDGGSVKPWGIWGVRGKDNYNAAVAPATNVTDDVDYRFYGGAIEVTAFDPITIGLDVMHGSQDTNVNANDASGWFAAARVSYKMDMLTASLVGFTSSGDDNDATDGSEVMPGLTVSGGGFGPTTLGTAGVFNMNSWNALTRGPGAQGLGIKLTDLSFVENMTHTVNLFYFRGTTDKDAATALPFAYGTAGDFTEEDSAIEFNFESRYNIYENLVAVLDLSMIDVDFKKSGIGARTAASSADADETAYRAGIEIQYNF